MKIVLAPAASRLAAALFLAAVCWLPAEPWAAAEMGDSEARTIQSTLPAVVNVGTHKVMGDGTSAENAASGQTGGQPSRIWVFFGSGFIIEPSGVIVTNWHVIDGAYEIHVTFEGGLRAPARVLAAARSVDIALLKVDVGHPLPTARFGNSDKLQVGDQVFAIGNPLGLGISVSAGIVSALDRNILDSPYGDFIQTDAAINHGNSGGPLIDGSGAVVGLDTALDSPTTGSVGLGFAMPSKSVRFVVDRLLRYGWVRPGWIGAKLQEVTPNMAEALGLPRTEGSIIARLDDNAPAMKAGLQVGDIILRYGDMVPHDTRALRRAIVEAPGGEAVTFTIWREGHELAVPVTIEVWPKSALLARDAPTAPLQPKPPAVPPDLGLTLAPLTEETRSKYGLPLDQAGVLVTGVAAGTDAALRALAAGDVILRVRNTPVNTPVDVQAGVDAARAEKRDFVLMLVLPKAERQTGPKWIAVRVSAG